MLSASWSTIGQRSSLAATRLTSPICRASAAVTTRPVKIMSLAQAGPTSLGSRWVPPSQGNAAVGQVGNGEPSVFRGDPEVGGQGQLQPVVESVPFHHRYNGQGQVRHRRRHLHEGQPAGKLSPSLCQQVLAAGWRGPRRRRRLSLQR